MATFEKLNVMFNYSVIIPHYNNASDLQRCLDSIPEREDVQVIVVDDNSDPTKVDFEHFPGLGRKNTEVVFSKGENGKGPGYARNVGMERAEGKWIVFCDSDDYLLPEANAAMDEYKDSDVEVVYFKVAKKTWEGEFAPYEMFNSAIDEAKKQNKPDPISYGVPSPIAKFMKRDFLMDNHIRFQQITGGDDMLFSMRIAVNLKKYGLSDTQLYCVVDRPGSLTRNNNWRGFYSYTKACCEVYRLIKPVGKGELAYSWIASWWGRLRAENRIAALLLLPKVMSVTGFMKALRCYKKAMKVKRWNWKNREK